MINYNVKQSNSVTTTGEHTRWKKVKLKVLTQWTK